jgi:hypothetical protein
LADTAHPQSHLSFDFPARFHDVHVRILPVVVNRYRKAVFVVLASVFLVCWLIGFTSSQFPVVPGGSTDSGKIENGGYFLGSHGHYTEVQPAEWHRRRRQEQIELYAWIGGAVSGVGALLVAPKRFGG